MTISGSIPGGSDGKQPPPRGDGRLRALGLMACLAPMVVWGCAKSSGAQSDSGAAGTGGVGTGGDGTGGAATSTGGQNADGGTSVPASGGRGAIGSGGAGGQAGGGVGQATGGRTPSASGGAPGSGGARVTDGGPPSDAAGGDAGPPPVEKAGVFVAVGYGGRRIRSTNDGVSWTDDQSLVASGGDDDQLLRTVTWADHQFVALGYRVMKSLDGRTWTDSGVNSINQWFGAVVYAQGELAAVGGYGLRATSVDGVAWTNRMIDTVASHSAAGLLYTADFGGRFISTNDDGRRSYSADGKTWVFSTGATATSSSHLAYGARVVVGLDTSDLVVSSDGGATWASAPPLATPCVGLVFAQGHFTALGTGHVYISIDGRSWTDQAVSGLVQAELAYGHGTYIALYNNAFRRSTNGRVWEPAVNVAGGNPLTWLTFGPLP